MYSQQKGDDEATDTADECGNDDGVPCSLYILYRDELETAADTDVLKVAEAEFPAITVTKQEVEAIGRAAIEQRECLLWFEQRCGWITASAFHTVIKCKSDAAARTIVADIVAPPLQKCKQRN